MDRLRVVGKRYKFDFKTPLGNFSPEAIKVLLHGAGEEKFDISHLFYSKSPVYTRFAGLYAHLHHRLKTASNSDTRYIRSFMRKGICTDCGGARLKKEPLSYRIAGRTIGDLVEMDIESLSRFLQTVKFSDRQERIATPILKEIGERLSFMMDVGVGYLNLNREARSLSGGESQRIRLATQIGTQLTGVLYVLDEPSIGLHPRDNRRLIESLKQLRDMGNSVLVVEHDREMIESADFVVDLGPGAGEHGGYVVSAGSPDMLAHRTNGMPSLTAEYLAGAREISIPPQAARTGQEGRSR